MLEMDLTDRLAHIRRAEVRADTSDGAYHVRPIGRSTVSISASCASVGSGHEESILEPQCDGAKCDSDLCRRKHVLYVTFHRDMIRWDHLRI